MNPSWELSSVARDRDMVTDDTELRCLSGSHLWQMPLYDGLRLLQEG
jgi:hypothetical protein